MLSFLFVCASWRMVYLLDWRLWTLFATLSRLRWFCKWYFSEYFFLNRTQNAWFFARQSFERWIRKMDWICGRRRSSPQHDRQKQSFLETFASLWPRNHRCRSNLLERLVGMYCAPEHNVFTGRRHTDGNASWHVEINRSPRHVLIRRLPGTIIQTNCEVEEPAIHGTTSQHPSNTLGLSGKTSKPREGRVILRCIQAQWNVDSWPEQFGRISVAQWAPSGPPLYEFKTDKTETSKNLLNPREP